MIILLQYFFDNFLKMVYCLIQGRWAFLSKVQSYKI